MLKLDGGFHNSEEIRINVSDKAYEALSIVKSGDMSIREWADMYLSVYQEKKLDNHFCGIKGCQCGSYERATILI